VVPEGFKVKALPKVDRNDVPSLLTHLTGGPQWARETAQRILYAERPVKLEMREIERLLDALVDRPAAGAALATVQACGKLSSGFVIHALRNENESGRVIALRMAERFMKDDPEMENAVHNLEGDPSLFVRFQLALSAGSLNPNLAGPLLARLLRRPDADRWLVSACLSSAKDTAPGLLAELAVDEKFAAAHPATLSQLAGMAGARGKDEDTLAVLTLLGKVKQPAAQLAILEGLGEGMRTRDASLGKWLAKPPAGAKDAADRIERFFRQAAETAQDEKAKPAARVAAARLLSYGPFRLAAEPLAGLLQPKSPPDVQSAALRALAGYDDPKVGPLILGPWEGYGPTLRREALEILLARKDRVTALLDAVETKRVLVSQIEAARADSLRKHADATIRDRATRLLAGQVAADRKKVLDDYRPALDLKGDAARGRDLFRKNCTACHRLENVGYEVGANLVAALRNKSKEALLIDILDPSREVDPRYVNYQVTTTTGRTVSGLLAVETPTSVTLRRGEKAEDTILRSQIEELRATTKSLMPEEFEKQLDKQQTADLIEYLMTVVK
jgi:putative heme-binding domain-containing protein